MKNKILDCLALLVVVFLLAMILYTPGCHSLPKDSYIKGLDSTVNTPWGPSTLKAVEVATGKAAQNASLDAPKK